MADEVDDMYRIDRAEPMVARWMCCAVRVSLKNRKLNEELNRRLSVMVVADVESCCGSYIRNVIDTC